MISKNISFRVLLFSLLLMTMMRADSLYAPSLTDGQSMQPTSAARSTQHSASRRAVEIQGVSHSRIHRRNHKGLSFRSETRMADEAFVQNLVNGIAVIYSSVCFPDNARPVSNREQFRHRVPQRETRRGVDSRRRRGMSEGLPSHANTPPLLCEKLIGWPNPRLLRESRSHEHTGNRSKH